MTSLVPLIWLCVLESIAVRLDALRCLALVDVAGEAVGQIELLILRQEVRLEQSTSNLL
jgi:hypothetical protein